MERVEFFVIVVFVFIVVVGATAVDMQLGFTVQAQQHAQWQITTMGLDHLDRWRQLLGHLGAAEQAREAQAQIELVARAVAQPGDVDLGRAVGADADRWVLAWTGARAPLIRPPPTRLPPRRPLANMRRDS